MVGLAAESRFKCGPGSLVTVELTSTVLVMMPLAFVFTFTVRVSVREEPAASVATLHVTVVPCNGGF